MVDDERPPSAATGPLQLLPRETVPPVLVGIDVVDLGNPRTAGKASDARFVGRVLSEDEVEALRADPNPDVDLWCRWAAKEAAYKVISKARGTPPSFVHRAFATGWQNQPVASEGGETPLRSGLVRYENFHVPVIARRSGDALYAVAFGLVREGGDVRTRVEGLEAPGERWSAPLEELEARMTERELDAVHSLPSAAVRIGARCDLAESLGISEERLEIVCPPGPIGLRPPHVLLDGKPTQRADVSLSHDGPWIAWITWAAGETSGFSGHEQE